MRLLLDTHVWLWSLLEPERISPQVLAELADPAAELWLSPISLWEVLVLSNRGRLELGPDPVQWVRRAWRASPIREAALNAEVALRSRELRLPHEDPADRFIVATAAVHELTLVTRDDRLLAQTHCATLRP